MESPGVYVIFGAESDGVCSKREGLANGQAILEFPAFVWDCSKRGGHGVMVVRANHINAANFYSPTLAHAA
jgi:hypothetical protein